MTGGDCKEQTQILREDLLSLNPTHIIFHNKSGRSSSAAHKVEHFFHKHIFIFNWIGKYNLVWGINDAIAGITLGLTIIPESIACALLAGLPARYGLCSAFIGSFIYVFLGSIDKVIIGPTSLVALVSVQFTLGKPIEFAFILTFLCGVVQVLMSLLQMGYIFEFISTPIIKAFSTATAVLVIVSQLKVLMGINFVVPGFIKTVKTLVLRYQETNIGDLSMGLAVILFLLLFEPLEKFSYNTRVNKGFRIFCRYLYFSRNTLVVLITALVTYIWLEKEFQVPYTLSENALSGLPNITLPDFHIESEDKFYNFWDIVKELNVGIIVVPIIGVLTNISIGKLNPRGTVNNNQELATLGLCNIFGSFVQAMPTAGGFTRYAISNHCGLKTPMANLYSGIIVLLALGYLSPYLYYIPEATLAAILIYSISSLLDFKLPQRLWHESKWDFVKWLICFLVCVLCGVEVGLLMGVIINIAYLLFLWARPEIDIKFKEMDGKPFISVTPGNGIYFPAINYLRDKVLKVASQTDFKITVIMDCHKVNGLDFTGSQGIVKLAKGLQANPDEMEAHTSQGEKCENDVLLIIYKLKTPLHRLIDPVDNLVYCENEDEIRELLTQKSIRKCGWHRIDVHD